MNEISIETAHGKLKLPAFFPDGTYGSVKAVCADDLREAGVPGIVMNAFHLYTKPGAGVIRKHGGINAFMNWDGPILTDSGGFQVFSLIRQNPKYGQILKDKIIFRPEKGEKTIFSPEKSMQLQFAVKSDIMVCLDVCTHPDDDFEAQKNSVETTIRWAKAAKKEYNLLCGGKKLKPGEKPLLLAVIQGGSSKELRSECAATLCEMGFDGYGYGGWPVDKNGALTEDMLEYTAGLMPEGTLKYAMGLGRPEEIVKLSQMGYDLFDCVIPTREARRHRLYVFNAGKPAEIDVFSKDFYSYLHIMDDKYASDTSPVSDACDCRLCRGYSKAYLRHLFKTADPLAFRFATIHNLRFYSMLMEALRG